MVLDSIQVGLLPEQTYGTCKHTYNVFLSATFQEDKVPSPCHTHSQDGKLTFSWFTFPLVKVILTVGLNVILCMFCQEKGTQYHLVLHNFLGASWYTVYTNILQKLHKTKRHLESQTDFFHLYSYFKDIIWHVWN